MTPCHDAAAGLESRVEDRGLAACYALRHETDTVLLKFSTGKDSTACWLRLRALFPHIIALYHYWCPDLAFVERTLRQYEAFFGQHIIRAPHPNFLNYQAQGAFQHPHRQLVCEAYNFGRATYESVTAAVCYDLGLDAIPWVALGTKAWDSPIRRKMAEASGAINATRHEFQPVLDLKHTDVLALLADAQCPLSHDYPVFCRSFDGLQYRYVSAIRQHYPEDYAVLCQHFPLLAVEWTRAAAYHTQRTMEKARGHGQEAAQDTLGGF